MGAIVSYIYFEKEFDPVNSKRLSVFAGRNSALPIDVNIVADIIIVTACPPTRIIFCM